MYHIKRERCVNWESCEKKLLTEILKPYASIIYNKDVTTNAKAMKHNAWSEITRRFNSLNVRNRDKKHIINQWRIMKVANSKAEQTKTTNIDSNIRVPTPSTEFEEMVHVKPLVYIVESKDIDFDDKASQIPIEKKLIKQEIMDDTPSASDISQIPIEKKLIQQGIMDDTPSASDDTNASTSTCKNSVRTISMQRSGTTQPMAEENRRKQIRLRKRKFISSLAETSLREMRYYRIQEDRRQEKEHLLRMQTIQAQHRQIIRNLKLQEKLIMKQLARR